MNNSTLNQFWKDAVLACLRSGKGAAYSVSEADAVAREYGRRLKQQAEEGDQQELLTTIKQENKL